MPVVGIPFEGLMEVVLVVYPYFGALKSLQSDVLRILQVPLKGRALVWMASYAVSFWITF